MDLWKLLEWSHDIAFKDPVDDVPCFAKHAETHGFTHLSVFRDIVRASGVAGSEGRTGETMVLGILLLLSPWFNVSAANVTTGAVNAVRYHGGHA